MSRTVGNHLADRLVEIGLRDWFGVPGDYNMSLMDQLLMQPKLNYIGCCNELNAGYAADGYARVNGAACVMTTFTVGSLSAVNAIAGAYSESLPVIIVTGVPNSNDYSSGHILHHTIGEEDFGQELRIFREVTCAQVTIKDVGKARSQIDYAITECLEKKKPVLIQICANIAALKAPIFDPVPIPFASPPKFTNENSLQVAETVAFLSKAATVTLVIGPLVRVCGASEAVLELAEAAGYPVAAASNAKGIFPEDHKQFIGMYWGVVSWPYCQQVVESSQALLTIGTVWNDYSSVAYTNLISPGKSVVVEPTRVTLGEQITFGRVHMVDFVKALTKSIKRNTAAMELHERIYDPPGVIQTNNLDSPLSIKHLFHHVQEFLTGNDHIVVDTGDSWFNTLRLRLPKGCGFDIQMQFGSIGWSVPAAVGAAAAARHHGRRIINIVGDGAFQMTAQEVATSIKAGLNPVVLLINNQCYTIEEELHKGPYNMIPVWKYTAFALAVAGPTPIFTAKAKTERELLAAFQEVRTAHKDKVCFIEVVTDPQDCSYEILEWGARLANYTGRAPNPQ